MSHIIAKWVPLFSIEEASIDDSHGDCGNMLAAVASFAVESGLVETGVGEAKDKWIRVLSDNTGTVFVLGVRVDTTGEIVYEGSAEVAGVPGTGSPTVVKSLTPQGCDSCHSKHEAFRFALLVVVFFILSI